MKILVSYFSASGVTEKVAVKIAKALDGDILEIVPKDKYTNSDLDWHDKTSRSSVEMTNESSRPEILNEVISNEYDKILIGFPIWWGIAPRVINTFIEANDLSNKDIYIFVTSGGSGCEYALEDLKRHYPNLNFVSARRFNGMENEEDYKKFVEGGV